MTPPLPARRQRYGPALLQQWYGVRLLVWRVLHFAVFSLVA